MRIMKIVNRKKILQAEAFYYRYFNENAINYFATAQQLHSRKTHRVGENSELVTEVGIMCYPQQLTSRSSFFSPVHSNIFLDLIQCKTRAFYQIKQTGLGISRRNK